MDFSTVQVSALLASPRKDLRLTSDELAVLRAFVDQADKLCELFEDVTQQLDELRKGKILTQTEEEDILRLRREHGDQRRTLNALVLWLRENKDAEIKQGRHAGRGLAKVIIGYLDAGERSDKTIEAYCNRLRVVKANEERVSEIALLLQDYHLFLKG